jgi:hypothetical protein
VQQDAAEAARWFREAAQRGHADAQLILAIMYAEGQGVKRDDVLAYSWATFAALNERLSDKAVPLRDKLTARMTKEQITAAEQQLNEWRTRPGRQ